MEVHRRPLASPFIQERTFPEDRSSSYFVMDRRNATQSLNRRVPDNSSGGSLSPTSALHRYQLQTKIKKGLLSEDALKSEEEILLEQRRLERKIDK